MTNFPEAFDRFALQILSADLSDEAHRRFQSLARMTALEKDRVLDFDDTRAQLVFVAYPTIHRVPNDASRT